MNQSFLRPLLRAVALLLLGFTAFGQIAVPSNINYQGVVLDAGGNPLPNGNTTLVFNVWDSAQGGNLLWGPVTYNNVAVVNGAFNTQIGGTDPNNQVLSAILANRATTANSFAFLELTVGSTVIQPRQQVLTAPYAFVANTAHSAETLLNSITPSQINGTLAPNQVPPLSALNGNLAPSQINGTLSSGQVPTLSNLSGQLNPAQINGTLAPNQVPPLLALNGNLAPSQINGTLSSGQVPTLSNLSGQLNPAQINGTLAPNQVPPLSALNGTLAASQVPPLSALNGTLNSSQLPSTLSGNGTIPVGGIIMWSGVNVPAGWALCNGNNNTPDLRDRFVMGSGGTHTTGATGGASQITLTASQLPSHNHSLGFDLVRDAANDNRYNNGYNFGNSGQRDRFSLVDDHNQYNFFYSESSRYTPTTQNAGNNSAVNIVPPFYTIAFIMRTQ